MARRARVIGARFQRVYFRENPLLHFVIVNFASRVFIKNAAHAVEIDKVDLLVLLCYK